MAAYPTFPDLSRKPKLATKTSHAIDPTIRDTMDNGMVSTRARFTRRRRRFAVQIDFLTNPDIAAFDQFLQVKAVYGANAFYFPDHRDPHNPQNLLVRFSKLPEYTDAGWIADQFRQNVAFEMEEV